MGVLYTYVLLAVMVVSGAKSDNLCRPALNELVQHEVASADLEEMLPSNGALLTCTLLFFLFYLVNEV